MLRQELSQEKILDLLVRQKSLGRETNEASAPENITVSDRVAAAIMYILANENIFKPYLVELNDKLRAAVPNVKLLSVPEEYVTISHYACPTMPASLLPSGEHLTRALDKILLEQENKHGVNLRRTVKDIPLFVGLVDADYGNAMISSGDIWNDDLPLNQLWLHGEKSHRKQHYIVTRYIDDHPDYFKAILNGESTHNIFRFLVAPQANHVFYDDQGHTRRHWHCTVDDARPDYAVINCEPTLTGPINVVEYILEKTFFAECPYLANAQYHSYCKPVFNAAQEAQRSVPEMFKAASEYTDADNSVRDPLIRSLNRKRLQRFANHVDFTQTNVGRSIAGILHLNPITPKLKPGFFADSKRHDNAVKNALYKKYGVKQSDKESSDLETILRRAAFNGNAQDVEFLVERFSVNVNAQDASKRRTAMHYVLAQAKLASKDAPEKVDSYRRCAEFLAKHDYDFTLTDSQEKTALHYDSFGWMSPYAKKSSIREISLSSSIRIIFN